MIHLPLLFVKQTLRWSLGAGCLLRINTCGEEPLLTPQGALELKYAFQLPPPPHWLSFTLDSGHGLSQTELEPWLSPHLVSEAILEGVKILSQCFPF